MKAYCLLPFGMRLGLALTLLAPMCFADSLSSQPNALAPSQEAPSAQPLAPTQPADANGVTTQASPPPTENEQTIARPIQPLTKEEIQILLREFSQAQSTQLQALKHRQQLEREEFENSLRPKRNEFERIEAQEKRDYFLKVKDAAMRRRFMDESTEKRKRFEKEYNAEIENLTKQFIARALDLQKKQTRNLAEFKKVLSQGKYPPAELWPASGW